MVENEKSFGYTLLLGVCMIISLMLIGKMLLYRPAPVHTPIGQPNAEGVQQGQTEGEGSKNMWLGEDEVAQMIEQYLPGDFPAKGISVAISHNGSVCAKGTLYKDKLAGYLESGSAMRSALIFLPAQFELQADFTAACSTEGQLTLTPQRIAAGGIELPVSALSPALSGALNEAVNQALQEKYEGYRSVRLMDGALELHA